MAFWYHLSFFLLLISGANCQGNGYCTVMKPSTSEKADKLPVLPVAFKTKVEANFVDMNLTSTISEYYDRDGNRGALIMLTKGRQQTIIYSYKTGEIFNINDQNRCVVTNITQDNFLFGDNVKDGKNHIFTTDGVMKIGGAWNEVTKNKTVIRGIPVRQWQTCQYWEAFNATFNVNYYFTDENWSPSDNFSPAPVRAHVKGQIVDWPKTRDFEHFYEYFDFKMDIGDDYSKFQTPDNVVCPGRMKTKKLPSIPNHYYYREEILQPESGSVQYADIWYDYENKLFRYDYRDGSNDGPFNNDHPLTRIHDYNTGAAYVIDKDTGDCTTSFLSNSSIDGLFSPEAYRNNGSYSIRMKNAMKLLYLDDSYTYEGQTTVRGAICDRYVSMRTDYKIPGRDDLGKLNSTFTYFFLASDTFDVPNTGDDSDNRAPFKIWVTVYSIGYEFIYNFLDFDEQQPPFTTYDVSQCFSEYNKLKLSMRFPVVYTNQEPKALALEAQIQLAENLKITPIRIQDLSVDYDNKNMYLYCTLLGPPPPSDQFTYMQTESVGRIDKTFTDVTDISICAQYCLDETGFSCKSYDICPSTKSCILSKVHAGNITKGGHPSCDHFSRTVDKSYVRQLPLLEAWGSLSELVQQRKFFLEIPLGGGSQTTAVPAISVDLVYGHLFDSDLPSVSGAYYYRQEIAIPQASVIQQADVWYDMDSKLVRFDKRASTPKAPFFSTNPMTYIHDFSTGLQYSIDKLLGNCTISAIQNYSLDTTAELSEKLSDGSYVTRIKNPLEIFFLDSSYKSAGQRTLRGVLCDVFESVRTDFYLPGDKTKRNSTFQYYFLSDRWMDVSDTTKTQAQDVPIRLDITIPETGFLAIYNFFDFEETEPSFKKFDVGACYSDNQKIRFQVQFNSTYHPYLDAAADFFDFATKETMAKYLQITPLRIQDSRVDYDEESVYFTATLVDRSPPSDQYVLTSGIRVQYEDDKEISNVASADVCAVYCSTESSFPCNSFDLCPAQKLCSLSKKHTSEGKVTSNEECLHYSRDVDAPAYVEAALGESWSALRDFVYKGVILIPVPYGTKIYTFAAVSIKDVLFTDRPAILQEENNMKKFKVFKTNTGITTTPYLLPQLSVDDCATACIAEENFDCESFSYCFSNGNCYLSTVHPMEAPANFTTPTTLCDLYGRNYVDDYTEMPGKTVLQDGAKTMTGIATPDDCARMCETERNFSCKSFDYCEDEKRCVLGKKHVFDLPVSDVEEKPECSHFSRRYVDDFQPSLGKEVVFKDNYIIDGVSNEECAKLCVEEETFSCKSFDFCANTTQCRLTSAKLNGIGQITIQDSAFCNHYKRMYFPDGTPYNPKAQTSNPQPQTNSPSGYSGAVLAAVSVSMAIVGVLVALGICGVIQRKRRNNDFQGTINFTKHMDE